MTEPVRYAIVGCGNIAGRHAQALAEVDEARLVAAWDLDPARAGEFCERTGARPAGSLSELLADDVEVCLATVPAQVHARVAFEALDAGKHVVVEKPIDVDPGEARNLVRTAQEVGRVLSVVSQHRFHDDVRWLADLLHGEQLGAPVSASVFSLWKRDQAYYEVPGRGHTDPTEGGVLINQAVHMIDLVLWMFGQVTSVSSHRATLTHSIAVEDTAALAFAFRSGALGSLVTSTSVHPQEPERLELRCAAGTAVVSGGRVTRWDFDEGVQAGPPPSAAEGWVAPDKLEPFRRQHRDICRAVRGDGTPLVTGEQSLAVVEFIQSAYRSAELGTIVAPDELPVGATSPA